MQFCLVFFRGLPAVEGASKGIFLVFEVPVYKTKATMPNFASKTFFYVINASKSHNWIVSNFSLQKALFTKYSVICVDFFQRANHELFFIV